MGRRKLSRGRYRAFKCRLGVHRIVIGALPPMLEDARPEPGDPQPGQWIVMTCCADCRHVASVRYASGPPLVLGLWKGEIEPGTIRLYGTEKPETPAGRDGRA